MSISSSSIFHFFWQLLVIILAPLFILLYFVLSPFMSLYDKYFGDKSIYEPLPSKKIIFPELSEWGKCFDQVYEYFQQNLEYKKIDFNQDYLLKKEYEVTYDATEMTDEDHPSVSQLKANWEFFKEEIEKKTSEFIKGFLGKGAYIDEQLIKNSFKVHSLLIYEDSLYLNCYAAFDEEHDIQIAIKNKCVEVIFG